jgi:hypothetical protein
MYMLEFVRITYNLFNSEHSNKMDIEFRDFDIQCHLVLEAIILWEINDRNRVVRPRKHLNAFLG